jgi:hypothetical protein
MSTLAVGRNDASGLIIESIGSNGKPDSKGAIIPSILSDATITVASIDSDNQSVTIQFKDQNGVNWSGYVGFYWWISSGAFHTCQSGAPVPTTTIGFDIMGFQTFINPNSYISNTSASTNPDLPGGEHITSTLIKGFSHSVTNENGKASLNFTTVGSGLSFNVVAGSVAQTALLLNQNP